MNPNASFKDSEITGSDQGVQEFQDLLKTLTSWQGSCEEAAALTAQLCECEHIVIETKSTVGFDHELLQRVSHVLHDLLCKHIPGLLLTDGSATEQLWGIIGCMWKLLFSIYDQAIVQASESHVADLTESVLLLLLNHKPEEKYNPISLKLMKGALEWLQHLQSLNPKRIDEQFILSLQPYLSSSIEKVLRMQALMVIHSSIEGMADNKHSLFVLTTEDMEFLKSQLSHAIDFSSHDVLELLLSLSHLPQNLEMMSLMNLLSSLSLIMEGDMNETEQEIAAQLIQRIMEYEVSSKREVSEEASTRDAIESNDHVQAAKVIRSSMLGESASSQDALTFQVNSLEELVFLTGYDVAVCVGQAEDPGSSLTDDQRSVRIHQALIALCQVISQAGSSGVQRIMSVPYCLDTLCILIRQHWLHVSRGQEKCSLPLCDLLLNLAGRLVMSLTDVSQLAQETVVQWGLILWLTCALDVFRKESDIEVIQPRLTCALLILQNCAAEAERHHVFDTGANTMLKCLVPYTKSSSPSVSFDAKIILLLIAPFLRRSDLKHLLLSPTQMKQILINLRSAIKDNKATLTLYGATCTVGEVMVWLERAAFVGENVDLMIDNGILELFPTLMRNQHQDTVSKGAKLLWTIACKDEVRKTVHQCSDIVASLKTVPNLKILEYVLQCIQFSNADTNTLVVYAGGCYEHRRYVECLQSCNKLLDHESVEQSLKFKGIQVLKCKALFKIYQAEYRLLKNERDLLSAQEFYGREKSCHDKLCEVISHLGAALDDSYIDDEGSMYLDCAMIDFIRGTNQLNELHRCMLCLKQEYDLKRSHIVPRSALDIFRSGFVQHEGNKGLIVAGAHPSKGQVYHTEKTITKFMLCGDCEMLLNKGGEQDFLTKFFTKIYDPSSSEALMAGQKLPYEGWLYHFCIGFLFRAIAGFVGIPNVMNHHQVYGFFKKCRKFLLERNHDLSAFPRVYLFTNPTKVPYEYKNEWVSETLVEPAFFDLPEIRLNGNDCHFPEAHFFVAHLGILNLLVTFPPADDVLIPEQFVVNPKGSMYMVPSEEQRLKFLPEGLKSVFSRISENIREDMKEFFFRREKHFPPVALKTADQALQNTVGLVEAINADFKVLMKSESVNTLPPSFHIDDATRTLQLPLQYRIMVHATILVEAVSSTFTYFIGLVDQRQPFVIVYQHSDSKTKCFGCLISEDDLTLKKYIGSIPSAIHPEIMKQFDSITTTFGDIIPIILSSKGFKDMKMLMDYFKNRVEEENVMDTKCPPTVGCWYCQDACINCMESSAPGFTSVTADGLKLQFCSQTCAESFSGEDVPLQVSAVLKPSTVDSEAVECRGGTHKPIFFIYAFARGGNKGTKFALKIYRSILSSDYCAHYCVRQLFTQQFSKFLISSEEVLPKMLVSSDPKAFTPTSPYWTVEEYLLQATRILFKCHKMFMKMNCCSENMMIQLDCPQQFISKFKKATSSEVIEHLATSLASYRIVSSISLDWSTNQIASLLFCIDNFKTMMENVSRESSEHILGSLLLLQIESLAETRVSELGGDQDLKFTVILSACDLAFALLSKDSVLVGANKDELRKLYSVLLDFVHSFDGMLHDLDEACVKAAFQLLHKCVQHQWMLEIANVTDTYNCLEPFLSRADHFRWLSLVALYPFLPQLSDKQKNLVLLTPTDIRYLIQGLQHSHSIPSTIKILSYAVSIKHNVKVLFDNAILELLAEVLEDESICQEDKECIALLIEKVVAADVNQLDLQEP